MRVGDRFLDRLLGGLTCGFLFGSPPSSLLFGFLVSNVVLDGLARGLGIGPRGGRVRSCCGSLASLLSYSVSQRLRHDLFPVGRPAHVIGPLTSRYVRGGRAAGLGNLSAVVITQAHDHDGAQHQHGDGARSGEQGTAWKRLAMHGWLPLVSGSPSVISE